MYYNEGRAGCGEFNVRPYIILQRLIVRICFRLSSALLLFRPKSSLSMESVIGPQEVAFFVENISQHFNKALSVNLGDASSGAFSYTYSLGKMSNRLRPLARFFVGPALIGWLTPRVSSFIYVGKLGFLISKYDQRRWEFSFLKSKNKRIVCYLVGSDIRSSKKMASLEELTNEENISTYQSLGLSRERLNQIDFRQKLFAKIIDDFSDATFSAKFDQASYLTRKTLPVMYFCPDSLFSDDASKFNSVDCPIVVHAPSNPIIKGTPIIRSAVRRLKLEGHHFQYIELMGITHQEVLSHLKNAHILINELYGFMPGVLAVEGMANSCAVITRADHKFEKDLGHESEHAWLSTPPYYLYEHLKKLLDSPDLMLQYAQNGYKWASTNARASTNGQKLESIIKKF